MASSSSVMRSNTDSRKSLLINDSVISAEESPLQREMETLSVSKRLVKTVAEKFNKDRKKKNHLGDYELNERITGRPFSSKCLNLHFKGGGCSRVGSCEEFDIIGKRQPSSSEHCIPNKGLPGVEKSLRKARAVEKCPSSSFVRISLPDDVLELILVRLPLTSLMAARLVCKKWSCLITTPQFMKLRSEGSFRSPWLFLFGATKREGCHAGEVHALDVVGDRWHRISTERLKDRFLFSVVSTGSSIYVVGGCSTLGDSRSLKKHKDVLVFSPLNGSWEEVCPMKVARSGPVLAVFEVSSNCSIFHAQSSRQDQGQDQTWLKARTRGVSDVYEDPHRLSLRRQPRDAHNESKNSQETKRKSTKLVGQGRSNQPKFALIAVGGRGSQDEPLDSGEVYDPITDNWIEIARWPRDLGAIVSGAVCNGVFYVYSEEDRLAGYDLERGLWVKLQTSQPPPRLRGYYPKLVSCSSRLFICCVCWCEGDGQVNRRERAVRKLWELDRVTHSWNEVSRHPDAPMDWNAALVADRERIYGVEMFRIFGQVLDFVTVCNASDSELNWSRISRKHVGHEADASSCMMKSLAVLHL